MPEPLVSIILRSYNEAWALRQTLPALCAQRYKNWELIVIDSGSTDGSVDLIRQANPRHFVQITHEQYNPARVMNQGMELARSEFGIFINADATPRGDNWLEPLVRALQDPGVAAVFGRQIARPDCRAVFAHDYERCFGENRETAKWGHFFSMASSGIRKDIWAKRGFLEKMQYSEDDEYTRWCRSQGYKIVYVPESVAMHSHNYTPGQAYKRSFGEARALAAVWEGDSGEINFPRTVMLGWANDARKDFVYCARRKRLHEWPHALGIRWHQRRGKLAGFRDGWKFYRDATGRDSASAGAPAPAARFTLDGSVEVENNLRETCKKVLAEIKSLIPVQKLEALVLGGGYGRGQGGVLKEANADHPYNDLEFYVFLRGSRLWNERKFGHALRVSGERLTNEARIHVEFKIESLPRLRGAPVSMFSYDLVSGHKVLWPQIAEGKIPLVFSGCERHLNADRIPLSEATRLLFNRCTGLLLAREILEKLTLTPKQADFVGRNLAKVRLALGDALLAASGQYHWSCLERRDRLARMEMSPDCRWLDDVKRHHAMGVEFKLHPRRILKPVSEFQAEYWEISRLASQVWLCLESRRLNRLFPTPHAYAFNPAPKLSGASPWRNLFLNLRTFGLRLGSASMSLRYPRERLFNALPLLLWDEPANDLRVRAYLQKQLRSTARDWQSLVAAYKDIWPKFS